MTPLGWPQFRLWVTIGQFCQFETSVEQTCTLRTLMCEGAFHLRNILESHCLVSWQHWPFYRRQYSLGVLPMIFSQADSGVWLAWRKAAVSCTILLILLRLLGKYLCVEGQLVGWVDVQFYKTLPDISPVLPHSLPPSV